MNRSKSLIFQRAAWLSAEGHLSEVDSSEFVCTAQWVAQTRRSWRLLLSVGQSIFVSRWSEYALLCARWACRAELHKAEAWACCTGAVCRSTLSMKAVRRLLEEDMGLTKKALDEDKDLVTRLVDQVRVCADVLSHPCQG